MTDYFYDIEVKTMSIVKLEEICSFFRMTPDDVACDLSGPDRICIFVPQDDKILEFSSNNDVIDYFGVPVDFDRDAMTFTTQKGKTFVYGGTNDSFEKLMNF